MPSANHETTLARQWELLKMLPSRGPGMTSRDLRDRLERAGHEVSKRTVERDLSELSRLFPIISNEISTPFGWHWKPGARVDFPGVDLAEAVSLGLLEDLLRQLIPPSFTEALEGRFSAAREKLRALPQNRYAKWSDLIRYMAPGLPLHQPSINSGVSRAVREALLRKLQLKVLYRGPGSTTNKELLLHPLAIIQQGERSYLMATTFDYADVLHYALHRMRSAEILDEPAKRPAHFSLDTFLAQGGGQFGDGKTISLKARLADNLATILRETAISSDQKITTRAGNNILTATVRDSWQLHFWILSQGPAITIIQPVSLKRQIVSQLKDALANYTT
jgi:predicted DNA-binding transcriptional regulator YafY